MASLINVYLAHAAARLPCGLKVDVRLPPIPGLSEAAMDLYRQAVELAWWDGFRTGCLAGIGAAVVLALVLRALSRP